jgi:hypothetical protein
LASKKAIGADFYWALALKRLLYNQPAMRVATVIHVSDVYVFAQNTSICNGDFVRSNKKCMFVNPNVVSDADRGSVMYSFIFYDCEHDAFCPHEASIPDANKLFTPESSWSLHDSVLS